MAILLLGSCPLWASAQDSLWQKAVEIAGRNKPWIPGVTVMRSEVLDDKGKLTDTFESLIRISPGADGSPVSTIEKATRNGEDVTEKEQKAMEERNRKAAKDGKSMSIGLEDNPFNPDLQQAVTVKDLGESKLLDGKSCAMYSFNLKKKDGTSLTGTAALERESGVPVEVSYTLSPLPFGVEKMTTVLTYADGPAGDGFLRGMSIDGTGAFLFIKRVFHSTISLDGYWKKEGA